VKLSLLRFENKYLLPSCLKKDKATAPQEKEKKRSSKLPKLSSPRIFKSNYKTKNQNKKRNEKNKTKNHQEEEI